MCKTKILKYNEILKRKRVKLIQLFKKNARKSVKKTTLYFYKMIYVYFNDFKLLVITKINSNQVHSQYYFR